MDEDQSRIKAYLLVISDQIPFTGFTLTLVNGTPVTQQGGFERTRNADSEYIGIISAVLLLLIELKHSRDRYDTFHMTGEAQALSVPAGPVGRIFQSAGVTVNGTEPADILIHHPLTIRRILTYGTLGLGESYMEGWWDVRELDELVYRLLDARADTLIARNTVLVLEGLKGRILNRQSGKRTYTVAERHYDLGNDLYRAMLDKRLVYTCAYWKDAATLDEAQERKLDLTCRKIGLTPGMSVLDIGCGFGSFARFAAERYGVHVTGITISGRQIELGNELCRGLPVELLYRDYHDITGTYDRIVSLGMFEHVGHRNYRTFMRIVRDHLKEDGIFLLHTIGGLTGPGADPWFDKYIFPNSELPTAESITRAIEGLFILEDWHNFGAYYDRTLMNWYANFERNWDTLKAAYGETFRRMWRFYLLSSAGAFRARRNQLWQIVLTRRGIPGGYRSIR